MKRRRQPETITVRVNADGSIAATTDPGVVIVKVGSGIYDAVLPRDFRFVSVTASTHATSYGATTLPGAATTAGAAFRVGINHTSTAAQADQPWTFTATGAPQ